MERTDIESILVQSMDLFSQISRRMPTVNAEGVCRFWACADRKLDGISSRPLRCHHSDPSQPLGVRRRHVPCSENTALEVKDLAEGILTSVIQEALQQAVGMGVDELKVDADGHIEV